MVSSAKAENGWPGDMAGDTDRIIIDVPDMTSGERVLELFERCCAMLARGRMHVEIDLRGVTAADTKLVACLVVLYQIARAASARLDVRLSAVVADVARVCRLERLIEEVDPAGGVLKSPVA